jgi:hypothetical protein
MWWTVDERISITQTCSNPSRLGQMVLTTSSRIAFTMRPERQQHVCCSLEGVNASQWWTVVVELSEPLSVEEEPTRFFESDRQPVEDRVSAFRLARVELAGRVTLRISAEVEGRHQFEATDQLWSVIEKVFYPDPEHLRFWSMKVNMSAKPMA